MATLTERQPASGIKSMICTANSLEALPVLRFPALNHFDLFCLIVNVHCTTVTVASQTLGQCKENAVGRGKRLTIFDNFQRWKRTWVMCKWQLHWIISLRISKRSGCKCPCSVSGRDAIKQSFWAVVYLSFWQPATTSLTGYSYPL